MDRTAIIEALRGAACHDLPAQTVENLRRIAADLDGGIDWRSLAIALLVKYGGAKGQALVGSGSLAFARDRVSFRADRDCDALVLHWDAPPLNELPSRK